MRQKAQPDANPRGTACSRASSASTTGENIAVALLSRRTTTRRGALSPVNGMILYNNNTGRIEAGLPVRVNARKDPPTLI